jgi:sucrose-6-phosphate hydrolase SacC (GH32 family)
MNWNGWDFFAPESLLTPDGRRVMWAWCNVGYPQSGIQSLGRELELPADGTLRIRPLRELERLRRGEKSEAGLTVRDGAPHRLAGIAGDTLELRLRIQPGMAAQVGLEVFCDAAGEGGFPILVEPGEGLLRLGDVRVPFALRPGEWIELRVFLDKNLVEVFANDRQAAVASHRHDRDHVGIRLISRGGDALVETLTAWRMASIYP